MLVGRGGGGVRVPVVMLRIGIASYFLMLCFVKNT